MPPPRPSAWEVSFPELALEPLREPEPPTSGNNKRKRDLPQYPSGAKRRQSEEHRRYYKENPRELEETRSLIVVGEKHIEDDEVGDTKPVRVLSNFTIFDPGHNLEVVSLGLLEEDDGEDRQFEGSGIVSPFFPNEELEDEGQEDDIDGQEIEPQFLRLTAILHYTIDYTKLDDPLYIETAHAWYILENPSPLYLSCYRKFYKPRRIAQLIVSSACTQPRRSYHDFLEEFLDTIDNILGEGFTESDLWDSISELKLSLEEIDESNTLVASPLIRHLLHGSPPVAPKSRAMSIHRPARVLTRLALTGNLDLAVLRRENQNSTHVTPFIAKIAAGFFRERLVVVGPPPAKPDEGIIEEEKKRQRERLRRYLAEATRDKVVSYDNNQRLKPRSMWLRAIDVNGETYSVGDVVIVPIGQNGNKKAPELPSDANIPSSASIPDFFWFARIMYISGEHETLHVQWFEHSSKTAMQEIHDPQELFLTDICDTIDPRCVVGKAAVHRYIPGGAFPEVKEDEYYFKFVYDATLATIVEINLQRERAASLDQPPDNCPVCLLGEQKQQEQFEQEIPGGIAYHGTTYHTRDFVLIRAEKGPCDIGQITKIRFPSTAHRDSSPRLTVNLLGRLDSIGGLPQNMLKDERHLFITNEEVQIRAAAIICKCLVFPLDALRNTSTREEVSQLSHWITTHGLSAWVEQSPYHFYIDYHFSASQNQVWPNRRRLLPGGLDLCASCWQEKWNEIRLMTKYIDSPIRKPLRTFDPFGGVGAFGLGMEETGCVKITHSIEISPSAAITMRRNSEELTIYNQCANIVLRYAIKALEGHHMDVPRDLNRDKPLPPPPKPGDIDCIVAGFPCQPHSRLNMFQKANDIKSNLILNVLSWVDFLKPKFCLFENVRGFLQFNLNATQASLYRVEGGIDMGGLKFVVRTMVAMNYQVRFGLLQAAHYGTPQARVRFFLIAARHGYPLPQLPQPTHDFPLTDALEIKFTNGSSIRPIQTAGGVAPYHFVSIDDAISDLPRFDWRNPRSHRETAAVRREAQDREGTIPALECKGNWTGFEGIVEYEHPPRTKFQEQCRKILTKDLQHYTRNLLPEKIESPYQSHQNPTRTKRGLQKSGPDSYEWQFANPSSAVAKARFRPGLYGRLDKDGWFSTTVTNMDPTAKQSRVLNPYCKRIITVRELARSQGFPDHFVFHSINDNVVTMHRQIGNAVPWLVAVALGRELRAALFNKWLLDREEAVIID